MKKQRVFVLGIDGGMPEKIFGEWKDDLPNMKRLMGDGSYARLNSTDPPLSITAWCSITTGKSPTDTGIFEYIYRKGKSYDDIVVMTSRNLKEKQIWEIISDRGLKSVVPYVINTWPLKPFDGWLVAGPQRPDDADKSVYPPELKEELIDKFGEVPSFDIPNFRSSYEIARKIKKEGPPKEFVIEECYKVAEKGVRVMEHLIKTKDWDLFFGVIGMTDRMNHMFWKYCDKTHRKYDPESKYLNVLKEFYKFIDVKIGELLDLLDKDDKVIILSDHGIMKLNTRVNTTDWLIREGYMVLKEKIKDKTPFTLDMVDWSKTKVFAIGAYEAQFFINLKGREPEGIVEPEDYDDLINELSGKLVEIPGDWGEKLKTEILYKKKDYDGKHVDDAPDMIVYFHGMQYGANSTLIGNDTLWSPSTAKGTDDATHSLQGVFIIKDNMNKNGDIGEISYLDVAPTVLHLLDTEIPGDMKGKVVGGNVIEGDGVMSKEEAMVWIGRVAKDNSNILENPSNLLDMHLPGSYDIAESTTKKILDNYPSLNGKIDVKKISLAAGLHDIGRLLKKDQAFHEIRGYEYIINEGLRSGVADSQEEVEEIARMMLPHGSAHEIFVHEHYSELRKEFSHINADQLIPRMLSQAIVDYSDMVNLNGEEVDLKVRIKELIDRSEKNNYPAMDALIDCSKRKIIIDAKIKSLLQGKLSVEVAERLVDDFNVELDIPIKNLEHS
jgi:predicted AlkP superfamily phosphohydrolase/phosphomutase